MKILLTIFIFSISATAFAQKNQLPYPNGVSVRVMSAEEANRLNGVAHPTIDGIPYEQYKAQQQALQARPQASSIRKLVNTASDHQISQANPISSAAGSKSVDTPASATNTPAVPVNAPATKTATPVEVKVPLQQAPFGQVGKPQQQ